MVWIGFFVIALVVSAIMDWGVVLPFAVLVALPIYLFVAKSRKEEKQLEAKHKALIQWRREQQLEYRSQMIDFSEQALDLFESLVNQLGSAEASLDQAELELADGAFAPFWDCVEDAAKSLSRVDECVRQITDNSQSYSDLMLRYKEAPPPFPLAHESVSKLAVANESAERMRTIVRKAQRDFKFASIYEQRKTNQILVAGFTDLAHALRDMTLQLSASIGELERSVGESLQAIHSRLGDIEVTASRHADQASMREVKALQMLDNIQRKRSPFP